MRKGRKQGRQHFPRRHQNLNPNPPSPNRRNSNHFTESAPKIPTTSNSSPLKSYNFLNQNGHGAKLVLYTLIYDKIIQGGTVYFSDCCGASYLTIRTSVYPSTEVKNSQVRDDLMEHPSEGDLVRHKPDDVCASYSLVCSSKRLYPDIERADGNDTKRHKQMGFEQELDSLTHRSSYMPNHPQFMNSSGARLANEPTDDKLVLYNLATMCKRKAIDSQTKVPKRSKVSQFSSPISQCKLAELPYLGSQLVKRKATLELRQDIPECAFRNKHFDNSGKRKSVDLDPVEVPSPKKICVSSSKANCDRKGVKNCKRKSKPKASTTPPAHEDTEKFVLSKGLNWTSTVPLNIETLVQKTKSWKKRFKQSLAAFFATDISSQTSQTNASTYSQSVNHGQPMQLVTGNIDRDSITFFKGVVAPQNESPQEP